jgi:CubicO group peptidase (beta-lactamase class C family)
VSKLFEKTLALMERQRRAGVYSGYLVSFLNEGKSERTLNGWAATVPTTERLTEHHSFDVASLTKVIGTTSVLLRLLDRKEIQLDDPLQMYLPEYVDSRVTIRHLVTHTSGIHTWIAHRNQLSASELKAAYLQQGASSEIGQRVQYTDTGFLLLGFMLEVIYGGIPLADIFQQEVFIPLHMMDTSLGYSGNLDEVVPTEQLVDGQVLRGIVHDPKARILGVHAGNAGIFSTLADLETFGQMYLQNGGSYLSTEVMRLTQEDQTPNHQGRRSLGWQLLGTNEQPKLFHTGYTGTFLLLDYHNQTGMIFLSNRVHPRDERQGYIEQRNQLVTCYRNEQNEQAESEE